MERLNNFSYYIMKLALSSETKIFYLATQNVFFIIFSLPLPLEKLLSKSKIFVLCVWLFML